jgi:hypothetical protein
MISRALDRQILDFVALLESQLARLIHTGHQRTKSLPRTVREEVLRGALVIAWRRREAFNPMNEPITAWFEGCLSAAREEVVVADSDELTMLDYLSPAAEPAKSPFVAAARIHEKVDASLKPGKDCPPCWRCNYHQGWLPKKWPYREGWVPANEMDLICKAIDDRKVEIAKYVQGHYDPALLEE